MCNAIPNDFGLHRLGANTTCSDTVRLGQLGPCINLVHGLCFRFNSVEPGSSLSTLCELCTSDMVSYFKLVSHCKSKSKSKNKNESKHARV